MHFSLVYYEYLISVRFRFDGFYVVMPVFILFGYCLTVFDLNLPRLISGTCRIYGCGGHVSFWLCCHQTLVLVLFE